MEQEKKKFLSGIVRWFDARKGYGFITDEDGFDHFVHYSEICGEGFKFLKPNDVVIFESVEDDRGRKVAKNVAADLDVLKEGAKS